MSIEDKKMPGCYGREDTGGMGNAGTDNIRTVELLKRIEKLADIDYDIRSCVCLLRRQNYDRGLRNVTGLLTLIENSVSDFESLETLLGCMSEAAKAQEAKDYELLADILELKLCEITENELEVLCSLADKSNDCEKIRDIKELGLEYTMSGDLTLKKSGAYIHSNSSPREEAFELSLSWIEQAFTRKTGDIRIFGLGLGYEAMELLNQNEYIKVTVYEPDLEMIEAASFVCDLRKYLENGRLSLIYDESAARWSEDKFQFMDSALFIYYMPALRIMEEGPVRSILKNDSIKEASFENQKYSLYGNFTINKTVIDNESLKNESDKVFKDIGSHIPVIVAAGPSLDKNFHMLKGIDRSRYRIIATGTILKKLAVSEIVPDYCIVTEANARCLKQIDGVENLTPAVLLYLSTSYYGFAKNFKGKKLILFQNGFDEAKRAAAEVFGNEKDRFMIDTGGSVTTAAMDLCIKAGAEKIIFIGLDLAYTGGFAHAEKSSRREAVLDANMPEVNDVNGEKLKTTPGMYMFKKWIENKIKEVTENGRNIRFINATEGGALTKGMVNMTFKEALLIK